MVSESGMHVYSSWNLCNDDKTTNRRIANNQHDTIGVVYWSRRDELDSFGPDPVQLSVLDRTFKRLVKIVVSCVTATLINK